MKKDKIAIITGVNGQDGSYLAEHLLGLGYIVHGLRRRSSIFNTSRIDHLLEDWHNDDCRFFLHYFDLTDSLSIVRLIKEISPDEIYNLAAMSHVHVSFDLPEYTANSDAIGTLRILEAVRLLGLTNSVRIYQASTSELYGKVQSVPQNEDTPFYPRSPYGVSKLYGFWICKNYREAYNMFICNGILFNHESPRRGETFVTRKITRGIAEMALGIKEVLYLGNMDALRDWGHAKDYVRGMHLMLQHENADDYVLATNRTISVRDFLTIAFRCIGIELEFIGEGINELVLIKSNSGNYPIFIEGKVVVKVDENFYRPTEVDLLIGDYTKAKQKLGWMPEVSVEELALEMVMHDLISLSHGPKN